MDPYSSLNNFLTQHSQNPNPNPNPNPHHEQPQYSTALNTGLTPPGVVQPHPSLTSSVLGYNYEAQPPYFQQQTVDAASIASLYPNASNSISSDLLAQYAALSYSINAAMAQSGTQQLAVTNPTYASWNNVTAQPNNGISPWKKWPKKTKLVQSAWCEVCKLALNSKEVLDKHRMGKRHKTNLEKLIAPAPASAPAPAPSAASSQTSNSIAGPQENPNKKPEKPAETVGDLLTKRRKVLECGAAVDAVRICTLCNVVCNSETVFRYHLSGQKHATMIQKYAAQAGLPPTT